MTGLGHVSLLGRLMPTVMRLRRSSRHYLTREHVRRHLQDLLVRPQPVHPPRRIRKGVSIRATMERGWRIYAITPTSTTPRGTVVYLHGGSWIHQAANAHWSWVQQLADEASATVLMPVYPLAHEGGTAARVVPVVAEMCEQAAGPVVLMGDSAGGSIAVSASLLLRERKSPVALTTLIAPCLDLSMSNPEIDLVQPQDPWLVKRGLLEVAEMWAGDDVNDRILNPILGDLRGMSPLMIFSGTRDILNPDTRLFTTRAAAAGVDVRYCELPGHIHAFPLLPIPEGRRARKEMVAAVRRAVTGTGHPLGNEPGSGSYSEQAKAAMRAAEAVLPPSGEVDEMLALVSKTRGRPITLLTQPLDQSLSGLLISTEQADYIAVSSDASPERRAAIVCHEVAHTLLGHDHNSPVSRSLIDPDLLRGVDDQLVRSIVAARQVYLDPAESDAEIVATYLSAELRRRVMRGGDTYYDDRWR